MPKFFLLLALVVFSSCTSLRSSPPPSTFIVFFRADTAELTTEGKQTVEQAASVIKTTKPKTIAVASGVARADNLRLAEPRFLAVSQALQAKGILPNSISRASLPDASMKLAPTGYERVEIILGGGSR